MSSADQVFAYAPISGSDWGFVAKTTKRKLHAPARRSIGIIAVMMFFLIVGGGVVMFIWQRPFTRALQQEIDERQLATAALQKSEARFRTIFNATNDAIFIHNKETGAILDVNRKMTEMFGYSRDEALLLDVGAISEGVSPYSQSEAVAWIHRAATGKPQLFEWHAKDKSGRLFWVEVNMRCATIGPEEQLVVSVRDLSERKKAERLLRKSEERYRSFVQSSVEGLYLLELKQPLLTAMPVEEQIKVLYKDAYIAEANDPLARMYGFAAGKEIHGKKLIDLYGSENNPEDVKFLRPFIESGYRITNIMFEELDQDGKPKYILNNVVGILGNGALFRVWVTQQDITGSQIAAAEIKAANEELRALNSIITVCAGTLDMGKILNTVLDEVLQISGLEGGTIGLARPQETLQIVAHRAISKATIEKLSGKAVKIGECLCGASARGHKPLILADREAVLQFLTRETIWGEDIRFYAAFPLLVGERCLGVLCIFTRTDVKPGERRLKLLETISSQIAISVENARMFEDLSQQSEILEEQVQERTAALSKSQAAMLNLLEDMAASREKMVRLNKQFVGRELRMRELKEKVKELEKAQGSQL